MEQGRLSRRDFLRTTTLCAGATLGVPAILIASQQPKVFRIALIGCGGRGRGAVNDALEAGKILGVEVRVVAVADYFPERALQAGKQFGVPPERCFGGPTAYQGVMESEAEIVLMAAPPLFRPVHFEAAVKAGKHVFMEKPVAVDPPGCRRMLAAGEEATKKGLVVVAGTQRRHDWNYRLTHQAVAVEGALGRLYAGRVSWCGGHAFARGPIRPQRPEDLVRTWQNWQSLSGDHIVEQHVHNIDIANWFCGHPPLSAVGFGGRARRPAGDMYDFFSVDFDYGDGVHIHSMCRQVAGCWNWVGQEFVYERGRTSGSDYPKPQNSPIPKDLPQAKSPYIQEHVDLLYAILKGQPLNETRSVTEATAAAVLGRTAAYTGRQVFWAEIVEDPKKNPELYNLTLKPTAEDFERGTVEIPEEGVVPRPGVAVG